MKKTFSMEVEAKVFLSSNEDVAEEEVNKIKEYLGVESLEEKVSITLKLENFLWYLFSKLPVPTAPLKIKAHDKFLTDISVKLNETVDKPEEPVSLAKEDLSKVQEFLTDDEEFQALDSAPFEALKVGGEEKDIKPLRLPAVNIYKDPEFVDTLCKVFE